MKETFPKEEFNGFDDIDVNLNSEDNERLQKEVEAEANKMNYLVHRVFQQNEQGRELMALWKESLIVQPSFEGHSTQFEAGLNEGEKRFVRNLILTINKVENNV